MKRFTCVFVVLLTFVSLSFAQQNDSPTGDQISANVILKAGSKLSGKLQTSLDVLKTKNSDDFVLVLIDEIRGGGVVIAKGSELLGRVVRVKEISADDNTSEISLFFDFVKIEDDYLSLKASVTSIAAENSEGENATEKKTSLFKIEMSPAFKGATVISTKGKNLVIDAGLLFQLKLEKDLVKP